MNQTNTLPTLIRTTRIAAIALCALMTVPAWASDAPDAESCVVSRHVSKISDGNATAGLILDGIVAWQYRSQHTGESIEDAVVGNIHFACNPTAKDAKECQETLNRIESAARMKRPIPFTTLLTRTATANGDTVVVPQGVTPGSAAAGAVHPLDSNIYMTSGTKSSCERAYKLAKLAQNHALEQLHVGNLSMKRAEDAPGNFKTPALPNRKNGDVRDPAIPELQWPAIQDINNFPATPAPQLDASKLNGLDTMPTPLDLDYEAMGFTDPSSANQGAGGCTIGSASRTATPLGLVLMLAVFALMAARLRKQTSP